MDDAHIGIVKHALKEPEIDESRRAKALDTIREVMGTSHKTFMYHVPLPTREAVYAKYPLEDPEGGALRAAHRRYQEIQEVPRCPLPEVVQDEIVREVPGVLPATLSSS